MFDFSGARIILGNNHVFRFNYPDQGMVFDCFEVIFVSLMRNFVRKLGNLFTSSPAREERIRQSRGNLLEDINGTLTSVLFCSISCQPCLPNVFKCEIEVDFSDITVMTNLKLFVNHINKRNKRCIEAPTLKITPLRIKPLLKRKVFKG